MRIPTLLAALLLSSAGALSIQAAMGQTAAPAPPGGTGQANEAVNSSGNAPSSVNASGTVRTVSMSDLARGSNSFTEGQARARIAGAGFANVTALTEDGDGIWRGRGEREGRSFEVGFDFKGQIAFR